MSRLCNFSRKKNMIFQPINSWIVIILMFLVVITSSCREQNESIMEMIDRGEFSKAAKQIEISLGENNSLAMDDKRKLQFELERMERIKKEFSATETDVIEFIKKDIPDLTKDQLRKWENEKSLEMKLIDGEKRYFKYAARNLFRVDKSCKKIWLEAHKKATSPKNTSFNRNDHAREIMLESKQSDQKYVKPIRQRIRYSIKVKENAVPAGEIIRCWIPFPREVPGRQTDITLINSEPAEYKIAGNQNLQRTIYLEKPANADSVTTFNIEYEYTSRGVFVNIDPDKVERVNPQDNLAPFLKEEPPHIVFTNELRNLSMSIVGDARNPYFVARKLFEWIDINIPWASAMDYSVISNISSYCYENKHGDCGIKALLFITLCRLNGIPASWQSGWRFTPPGNNMHDWGMIYFEPYGWIPMDVDFGMRQSEDEKLRFFYLNGIDSYRLIFNDAYSQPFQPRKKYFRSDMIDSQRGELEWRGGNLYYDKWNWDMNWEEVNK